MSFFIITVVSRDATFPKLRLHHEKQIACMHCHARICDIITVLLYTYAHECATVLYQAHLVIDRNSSDQNNNRLAL